jgi:hypothetical protein
MQLPPEARGSRASSIALSIVLHAALILLIRAYVWIPIVQKDQPVFHVFNLDALPKESPVPVAAPPIAEADAAPDLPEPAPLTPTRIAQPAEDEEPLLTQPAIVPSGIPASGEAVAPPNPAAVRGSPAQRFQRRIVEPSLWVGPATAFPAPVTPEEAAAGRLATGIRSFNDSVAAAAAADERATDWTVKDKDGGRWGVSPGAIHIGSVTLPLPFGFSGPTGRREETADKMRTYAESNAQAKRLEMEETFESRAKALRARKDAERDSARAARARNGGNED